MPDTERFDSQWLEMNCRFAATWPNTSKKRPPADANAMNGVSGKSERYFSPEPGTGD